MQMQNSFTVCKTLVFLSGVREFFKQCSHASRTQTKLSFVFLTLEKSNFWQKNGYFKKICGWMCYFIEYLWKEGLIRRFKLQTGLINIILSWEKRKRHTRRTVKTATKKNKLVYFTTSKLVFICQCQVKIIQIKVSVKG